jgi:hypothetical protein
MMFAPIRTVSTVFIAAALILTVPAMAHHGWSYYKDQIEIVVTIKELKLGNPHDRLVAIDADGQEWNLLLAPPARNRRFGFMEDTLSVGDEIELFGQKHPKKFEVKVHYINIDGANVYTYKYDNGRTSMERMRITKED